MGDLNWSSNVPRRWNVGTAWRASSTAAATGSQQRSLSVNENRFFVSCPCALPTSRWLRSSCGGLPSVQAPKFARLARPLVNDESVGVGSDDRRGAVLCADLRHSPAGPEPEHDGRHELDPGWQRSPGRRLLRFQRDRFFHR
ncbi:hypothetical protein [Lysobacter gummosus]|uniref:hypothetical protein n=1 Tax=Lysobacter gummosus TaxID=262324 RepID=UPI003639856B